MLDNDNSSSSGDKIHEKIGNTTDDDSIFDLGLDGLRSLSFCFYRMEGL